MIKRLYRSPAAWICLLLPAVSACTQLAERRPGEVAVSGLAASDNVATELARDEPAGLPGFTTAQARQALLGKWYGIAQGRGGLRREWLVERAADGTYRTDFRITHPDGRVDSQAEVGFWGVSGGIYFRIFRGWVMVDGMKLANPENPSHYDAYRIELLTGELMRYQHSENGRRYTMKRMADSFRLPVVLERRDSAPLKFEF